MMIGDIAKGGAPRRWTALPTSAAPTTIQCTGIANVLTGRVTATGALTDTPIPWTMLPFLP